MDTPPDERTAFMTAEQGCHASFARPGPVLAHGRMLAEHLMQKVLLPAFHHFERTERPKQLLHHLLRALCAW
jgi:hypothetical protein